MELDRFKTAWQQQGLEGAAARPMEDIMEAVHVTATRFNRQIWMRDLLETLAGLLVIGAFGYYIWVVPEVLAKIGAAIVIVGCVGVITRLHRARRRHRAAPDASAREFCATELKRLDEQIHLLSTVGWWYLAPLLGGAAIFVLGVGGSARARLVTLVVMLAFAVLIHHVNRRAVQRQLRPMRDELARTLDDMPVVER